MRNLAGLIFVACLVVVAELVCDARLVSPAIFPAPHATAYALFAAIMSGALWLPLAQTVEHLLVGWLCACVVGTALGALIGITTLGREYFAPTLEFLRPLPASAIAPVALLLIGRNDAMIVAVVVFGAIWPVTLASATGFRAVEPRLNEVARTLRLSGWKVFRTVALPSALPAIIAGARVSIAIALILAVVAEILASIGGLGDWLNLAERSYRAPDLYAGVVVIGALGVATNYALERVEARLLRWKRRSAW
jgi:ABC-type nitrate/sulfonate/bicarbonate transport system permease component